MTKQPEFDIYPKLDRDIQVARGDQTLVDNLVSEVDNDIAQARVEKEFPKDSETWASNEVAALSVKWDKYKSHIASVADNVIIKSLFDHENTSFSTDKINRLYQAKKRFLTVNLFLPNQENKRVGEEMDLVAIPWQEYWGHIEDTHFVDWLADLRKTQGIAAEDSIDDDLIAAVWTNKPLYRHPANPSQLISAREYLGYRLSTDGPWGVMLMQTGKGAGYEQMTAQSPDDLTSLGMRHLEVAGHAVDGMGIFEWLALTTQENPTNISADDVSLLLANRLIIEDKAQVPCGYFNRSMNRASIPLGDASKPSPTAKPRLAIE